MATEGFFLLYANLLSKDARSCWDKIVSGQVGEAPWTNLQGNEYKKERGKCMESFQDCNTFQFLHMFPNNAAKQQCFYISNVLKKPQHSSEQNSSTAISHTYLVPTAALAQLLQLSPFNLLTRLN